MFTIERGKFLIICEIFIFQNSGGIEPLMHYPDNNMRVTELELCFFLHL